MTSQHIIVRVVRVNANRTFTNNELENVYKGNQESGGDYLSSESNICTTRHVIHC